MRKYLVALLLAGAASAAYAACSTSTIFIDGRFITCTTCCYSSGMCTTTCL